MNLADEHLRSKGLRMSCCLAGIQNSLQYFAFPPQHRASALESNFIKRLLLARKVHSKAKMFNPLKR